ncbi:MAG: cytochrome P450 [Ilumatobacter sp.]|uniref:cytochrome P450 n=1 Tax=Ilumatobacter sp. TaxID=1967498 RepID=UPI002617940F|nr:cytochrome P450 [Ilumatobacter sp.]MDJ0769450.1 cytochrome P450 [Ilumatobacter sp.]
MSTTEPVDDWVDDFEIFDDAFVKDPYPIWKDLRDQGCPFARTERRQTTFMPTTFDAVREVTSRTDDFSSYSVTVTPTPTFFDDEGHRIRSIITTDAPDHTPERRLMLPFFAPKAVERYREHTQELCRTLIRGFIEDGRADFAEDYARQIPPRIIAAILGIDPEMSDEFTTWVQGLLELGLQDDEIREHYAEIIRNFFVGEIMDRIENPGDDLISFLLQAELDGGPVPVSVIRGNVGLMLIAGIDTTWSSIGSALWHLASHPEDRQRLVDEPELIPTAVEEFLRAYSPVTMARVATRDTQLGDREVKEGDRVILPFPAANRDPEMFEDPEEIIIDRQVNRHVAFGAGIHRCAGSNLARMEMQVAITEMLAMIPEFELEDPDAVTWAGGQVRGPRHLPVTFPVRSGL